jgi:hypothetical protein
MNMDIGDNRETSLATQLPQWSVSGAVEDNDSGLQ